MIVNSATKALQIAAPALKEAAPEALKKAAPFVPVIGSAYGFGQTCFQVYKSTSPSGAIMDFAVFRTVD